MSNQLFDPDIAIFSVANICYGHMASKHGSWEFKELQSLWSFHSTELLICSGSLPLC